MDSHARSTLTKWTAEGIEGELGKNKPMCKRQSKMVSDILEGDEQRQRTTMNRMQ